MAGNSDLLRSYRIHCLHKHLLGEMAPKNRRNDSMRAYLRLLRNSHPAGPSRSSWLDKRCLRDLHKWRWVEQ